MCFDVTDNFGEARYVVKGVGLTPNQYTHLDVRANTDFIHNKRFKSVDSEGEAGKESVSAASAEVGAFNELVKVNPNLSLDFNCPIWQPVSIINTGNKMIEGDNVWLNDHWAYWPFAQYSVVDVRRFPYTHWRIEDICFDSSRPEGIRELAVLGRKWNLPSRPQIYMRSIKRWSQASNMFINSEVKHTQVFDNFKHKETGLQYGWINLNNISLDGSTGDLDSSRKYIHKWNDQKRGRLEATGGFLIYLFGVHKIDPQLLENNDFLGSALDTFLNNLQKVSRQTIKNEHDFLTIAGYCKNSQILYDRKIHEGNFMPGRSDFEKHKNITEILPFMENIALRLNDLIH